MGFAYEVVPILLAEPSVMTTYQQRVEAMVSFTETHQAFVVKERRRLETESDRKEIVARMLKHCQHGEIVFRLHFSGFVTHHNWTNRCLAVLLRNRLMCELLAETL